MDSVSRREVRTQGFSVRSVGRFGVAQTEAKKPEELERCRDRARNPRRQEPRRHCTETADGLRLVQKRQR